ncbi:C-type lectin domain family 9 member A [Clarias gariepinus]|uniref:C-type lectin domain family 9 member A n=1 Tax=Clarias gariepinus TaxID=13013 RepID=UPI00234DD6B7|nr:C-type lectin domain family 9 member A [Clarias gariepinus]
MMEDDVNYSTIVFRTSHSAVPKGVPETENVVYSKIRTTREKSTQCSSSTAEEVTTSKCQSYKRATAVLGLLCVLLLAGLPTMCVLYIRQISKYSTILALYNNESTAHRLLQADKAALEKDKEELTAQTDEFRTSMRHITQLSNFPVNKYCTTTNGKLYCEPCMKNWIQNGPSCYLFHLYRPWMTWGQSQDYCAERGGHLVVIDTLQEQAWDRHCIQWLDFWSVPPKNPQDGCILLNPNRANQSNWVVNQCTMFNRCICEIKVMTWPSQL